MKKYFYILLSLVALAGFTACSDDDLVGTHNLENSVSIIKQDVCFDAAGGQGTVTFNAPGAATVKSSADWCHASVNGTTVTITADANPNYEGRNAVVTISCGNDSREVSVVQKGIVIEFKYASQTIEVSSGSSSFVIKGISTDPLTITCNQDWVKYSVAENGDITVNVEKNQAYNARTAILTLSAPDHDNKAVITIKQAERTLPSAEGTYAMTYQDANGNDFSKDVKLTASKDDPNLFYLTGFEDWQVPMYRDTENERFYIKNVCPIGTYTDSSASYYMAVTINYTDADTKTKNYYSSNTTSDQYWIYFSYTIDDGNKYNIDMIDMINVLSAGKYIMYGFSFRGYAEESLTTSKKAISYVRYPSLKQK